MVYRNRNSMGMWQAAGSSWAEMVMKDLITSMWYVFHTLEPNVKQPRHVAMAHKNTTLEVAQPGKTLPSPENAQRAREHAVLEPPEPDQEGGAI
jgi:hypothetical protein